MDTSVKRRDFLKTTAAIGAATLAGNPVQAAERFMHRSGASGGPLVISSANGLKATAKAMELIQKGADALDAVVAGVNIVENDPTDHSVGYGGLPNEDGVVELDASVMHGPTARGGAVGALRNIKNASNVAKMVMERTDHVLLVGEGALRFAKAHGFKEENLLTDEAREIWLKWKESMSTKDDWLPPNSMNSSKDMGMNWAEFHRLTGTINCNAIDMKGNISGVTTTAGLAFKIPGRVGDSPILGAGLFVDNEVGAAGSTGLGEANLLTCASVMVVEYMRQGKSPEQACMESCKRIVSKTKLPRLLNDAGKPNFNVTFYALNNKGEHGGAAIWAGSKYAINTGQPESHLLDCAYLFKK